MPLVQWQYVRYARALLWGGMSTLEIVNILTHTHHMTAAAAWIVVSDAAHKNRMYGKPLPIAGYQQRTRSRKR